MEDSVGVHVPNDDNGNFSNCLKDAEHEVKNEEKFIETLSKPTPSIASSEKPLTNGTDGSLRHVEQAETKQVITDVHDKHPLKSGVGKTSKPFSSTPCIGDLGIASGFGLGSRSTSSSSPANSVPVSGHVDALSSENHEFVYMFEYSLFL